MKAERMSRFFECLKDGGSAAESHPCSKTDLLFSAVTFQKIFLILLRYFHGVLIPFFKVFSESRVFQLGRVFLDVLFLSEGIKDRNIVFCLVFCDVLNRMHALFEESDKLVIN